MRAATQEHAPETDRPDDRTGRPNAPDVPADGHEGDSWGGRAVPPAVHAVAAWAWRALLIGAVVYFVVQFGLRVGSVVLALFVGLLLTALLRPAADWLERHGLPRLAATWLLLVTTVAGLAGVAVLIQQRVTAQLPSLRRSLADGLSRLRDLLVERLGLPPEQIDSIRQGLVAQVTGFGSGAGSGGGSGSLPTVIQAASLFLTVLAGLALALFTAFWLVYDGERVGRFLVGLAPRRYERTATRAGADAWDTAGGYLRGVTLVALMDALGIGVALLLIGVPLVFTLALITFLGAYIPIVGAVVAGLLAVLVALAAKGVTAALLTLGAVLLVQQLEGNVLQPMIMSRTVSLHPLAIVYALTVGGVLWGIAGALLAVPLTAALHAAATGIQRSRSRPDQAASREVPAARE